MLRNVTPRKVSADWVSLFGESLNAAGNKNEARKHYQKYLELSPDAEDRLEIEAILNKSFNSSKNLSLFC